MEQIERYLYRCTTDKLTMHIRHIEESGDTVEWPVFVGGRDWVLVCRKGPALVSDAIREQTDRLNASLAALAELAGKPAYPRTES